MPHYRIIPTLAVALLVPLWAAAQQAAAPPQQAAAAKAPAAPPTEAEKTLDEAIAKVKAIPRVSAEVAESVEMLNQDFRISGRYLKDTGSRVYLRLDLKGLAGATGTMLQVCDGTTLWDYAQILGQPSLRKFQVAAIMQKLNNPDIDPELHDAVVRTLGFTGPDALLTGIRQAFTLDQKAEDTLDGKAVWVLGGKWKDYEGLTPPGAPPFPATAPLPTYVPNSVRAFIGKEDGWPYRVELTGRALSVLELNADDRPRDLNGNPIGVKTRRDPEKPTRIVMTYSAVDLNPSLSPGDFAFQAPPNIQVLDGTDQIAAQLENAINERAARKRAEAAKAGDTLPSLNIQTPPDTPPPPADSFRSTTPPPKAP